MWRSHHKYLSIHSLYLFTIMHKPRSPIKIFLKGETSHRLWKNKKTKTKTKTKPKKKKKKNTHTHTEWTRGRILMLTQSNP